MRFFNLHTHRFSADASVLELVNQYPNDFSADVHYYSIGIHPWHITENRLDADLQIIEEKLKEPNCLAVGECGLDKRIETPIALQQQVFEAQLGLAEKYKKPVVLHCVAAFSEMIAIKNRLRITVPMIIHGFSKNSETAKQLLDHGFYLSFGKYLLQNPELKSVFNSVPSDRFFLETDTVENGIDEVYDLASEYRNISTEQLKQIIAENFRTVFKREIN